MTVIIEKKKEKDILNLIQQEKNLFFSFFHRYFKAIA